MLQLTTFNTINTTSDSAATTVPVIATLPITMPAANSEKAPVSKTAKASTAKTAKTSTADTVKDSTADSTKASTAKTAKTSTADTTNASTAKTAKASTADTVKDSTANTVKDSTANTIKDSAAKTAKASTADTIKDSAAKTAKASTANPTKAPVRVTKKQAKINLQNTITSVLATGDALAIKHDDYFDTYIKKGNEALNELLTEIMAFAETVFASTNVEEVIKAIRKKLKDSYDIRVQKNSNNIAIIVRYITRTNRKNAHVYSRAIKLAFDAGKTSAELANFIDENGGISKIREKNVNAAAIELKEKKDKSFKFYTENLLEEIAQNRPIATFQVDKKIESEIYDMTRGSVFSFMICRSKGNGKFAVIDAMVNLDKKFEEKVYLDYFHYKLNDHAMWYGEESAIAEFTKRMKDKIDEYNVKRAKNGMNLLNIYGEQIKNKMEDSNEIKELDLIDSTENCLEESSSL